MRTQPAFEIVLKAHGQAVTLRGSLRAAAAIDAMPGGFSQVWDQIARQSLSTIQAVILASATDQQDAHRFLNATAHMPLSKPLADSQAACLAVLVSYQNEPTELPQGQTTATEAIPLRDYFQMLYQYATGWLDWTPSETWTASPAEIEAAFTAHVDRRVKMTPGLTSNIGDGTAASTSTPYTPERLSEIEQLGHDPAFDRVAFASLKARHQQI